MTTPYLSAAMAADLHALVRAWYQEHGAPENLEAAELLAAEVGRAAAACAFECGAAACGERAGYRGITGITLPGGSSILIRTPDA